MRVALVHDYLTELGGAERVLQALCELFPYAPIYTLIYDERSTRGLFKDRRIHTSFLQRMPYAKTRHRNYAWLMPLAAEQFDLAKYDLVISDSASYAKGIVTKPHTVHISYCHTPIRYAWDDSHRYVKEFGAPLFLRHLIPFFLNYLRIWDKEAALRVDAFIANSSFVKERIRKYYRVDAQVIHPPVDIEFFSAEKRKVQDYFLAAGRLVAYKRFDLAIRAFNELQLPLVVAGEGPELKRLKNISGKTITFAGHVSDQDLRSLYTGARALIFPQEEDFGITAVEAMAVGCPVIAYRGGGALENIVEGKTGIFFDHERPGTLSKAVEQFSKTQFDSDVIREHAQKFSKEMFKQKMQEVIANTLNPNFKAQISNQIQNPKFK
ncbi:MAG: glycosyltransferase [bacterium]|nr:glycosyltransferase [bacterium]